MRVVVGRVLRAHGVRGDVLVEVRTDQPQLRFRAGAELRVGTGGEALEVAGAARHGDRMRVRFCGVSDRDAAVALRGVELAVESDELPRGDDSDEFHDADLIGLAAVTVDGGPIGTVTDVLHPAQDILVIDSGDGADEVFVPFVEAIVPRVDLVAGQVVVDAPPGLLDDAAT